VRIFYAIANHSQLLWGRSDNESPAARCAGGRPDSSGAPPLVVDSVTLMAGRRELLIRHGDDVYRLRITASNKLILTK
jgi:hemin uptake protein HemP